MAEFHLTLGQGGAGDVTKKEKETGPKNQNYGGA